MSSIEKRIREGGSTTYLARWRDPSGIQCKQTFARKRDADAHLTRIEQSKLSGEYVSRERGRMTVADWSARWLATRTGSLKPKTVESYESLLRTRVLPTWGTVPLARVTYEGVGAWVAQMRGELSASRTRQAYHLMTAMLDGAVRAGRLARNPAAGVELPRLPTTTRRYLTHAQVAALAEASGRHRTLVLTLAYTGLRWGEATALRVGSMDLLRGRLEVVEAVVDVNGRMIFGAPKSHQSRSVPVPSFLRDDLAAQLAGKAPRDFVFPSSTGSPLRVQNWRRGCFDRAARNVGLDGLVPHELRHTAASLAIASGASVKAVQAMLGHASATLTLDRYGHLFEGELDALADRLDAAARAQSVPQVCPPATVTPITQRETAS